MPEAAITALCGTSYYAPPLTSVAAPKNVSLLDVFAMLNERGWKVVRKGPGSHVQLKHSTKAGLITFDLLGADVPAETLRTVSCLAGHLD